MSIEKAASKVLVWSAAGLFLAACASSGSGDGAGESQPISALISADALVFVSFDADQDAVLTMAEIEQGLGVEWARADTNSDGMLAPLEFSRWSDLALGGGAMSPYRLDFDRNVDNTITEEEFRSEFLARARDYDSDGDGRITRAEMIRQVARPRLLSEQPSPFGGGRRLPGSMGERR